HLVQRIHARLGVHTCDRDAALLGAVGLGARSRMGPGSFGFSRRLVRLRLLGLMFGRRLGHASVLFDRALLAAKRSNFDVRGLCHVPPPPRLRAAPIVWGISSLPWLPLRSRKPSRSLARASRKKATPRHAGAARLPSRPKPRGPSCEKSFRLQTTW